MSRSCNESIYTVFLIPSLEPRTAAEPFFESASVAFLKKVPATGFESATAAELFESSSFEATAAVAVAESFVPIHAYNGRKGEEVCVFKQVPSLKIMRLCRFVFVSWFVKCKAVVARSGARRKQGSETGI